MSNKILLLLVCVFTILSFSACRNENPSNNSGNGNLPENSDENNNAIYGEGIKTYIVIDGSDSDEAYTQFLNDLMYEIYMKAESSTVLANNTSEEKSHEIVLGNSERSVTQKAYEKLDKKINQVIEEEYGYNVEEDIIGYAIYSTGKSVAVVWNHERLKYDALNCFVDNYVVEEKLVLNEGYSHTETYSYSEILEQDDKIEREREWNEVEKVLGAEATNALKNYYSLFNEDLYYWLADLYDPDIGGFYYSNSARNSEGYLPDIESTAQALAFLSRTMPEKNWMDILPDEMLEKILSFTKGLQSSTDGYFYHPQWEGMTYTVSRLGRDVDWATGIIEQYYNKYRAIYEEQGLSEEEINEKLLEYMPLWNAPNGVLGALGKPGVSATSLTAKLSLSSSVIAASKVLSTASSGWITQLRSLEAWSNYLYSRDLSANSYSIGNDLSSLISQIEARENAAIQNGEATGYIEITKNYLNAGAERFKNGVWEKEVTYQALNGLMKISRLYDHFKWRLPYPDQSLEAAITMTLKTDADANGRETIHATDVYNTWVAIENVLDTERKAIADKDERSKRISELQAVITENAAEMITATTKKIAKFAKNDGSYGYTWDFSPQNSQGMPVALADTVEGDINGTGLCCTYLLGDMAATLGIYDILPSLYGKSDSKKFQYYLRTLGTIIKDPSPEEDSVKYTFEDDAIGDSPMDVTGQCDEGEQIIVKHNAPKRDNVNALKFSDTSAEKNIFNSIVFSAGGVPFGMAQSGVFEFDVYFDEISSNTYLQIALSSCYMLTVKGDGNGGVKLGDASSNTGSDIIYTDLGVTIPEKEWHTLRVEYYFGSKDEVRIKIYVDSYLRAESTNYYGNKSTDAPDPKKDIKTLSITSTWTSTCSMYIDNLYVGRSERRYTEEEIYNPERLKDFEKSSGETDYPAGLTATNAIIVDNSEIADSKILSLSAADSSAIFETTTRNKPYNVYVYEMDMYVSSDKAGEIARLYMDKGSVKASIYALSVQIIETDGEKHISLVPIDSSGVKADRIYGEAPIEEWFSLRVEYYIYQYNSDYSEVSSKIYINDKLAAFDTTTYSYYNVGFDYLNFRFNKSSDAVVYIDNVIAEKDLITFVDKDENEIPDPESPSFPKGGAGSAVTEDESYTGEMNFDDSELGVPSVPGLTTIPNSEEFGNSIEIANDPENEENKSLKFDTNATIASGVGNIMRAVAKIMSANANCSVLEFDIYIDEGNVDYQILLGNQFMFTISGKQSSGDVKLNVLTARTGNDRYSESTGIALGYNEWHTVRVEYYDGTAETVRIKIIVGDTVYETNCYYGKKASAETIPSTVYNWAEFYSAFSSNATVYFDNLTVQKIEKEFVSSKPAEPESDGRGTGKNYNLSQGFAGLSVLPTAPYKVTSLDGGLKGNIGDANWTAIVDSSTDAYLDIGRNGGTTGSTPLFWFAKDADSTKYIFEIDIKWGGCNAASGTYPINVKFSDGTNSVAIAMYVNADGDLYIDKNGVDLTLVKGAWSNLRVEITYVSDTAATFAWYLNGEEAGTYSATFNAKNATWVQFEIRGSQYCAGNDTFNISFDNLYAAPHREDYRGKGENASSAQTFTGLTVLPSAPYKITSVDGGLKGNQGDANWTVIADGSTDAYLDIGRNGGTTGSTPLFWFAKDASATKYVFETDIKWGGCNAASGAYPINVKFSDGKNSPSIAMYVNADGDLYINKNGVNLTLHKGLWFNLRIEITYVSDTEAIFDWYLNGDKVGSFTNVFNAKNATWVQYEIRGSQFCTGNDVFNIAFDNVYTGGQS